MLLFANKQQKMENCTKITYFYYLVQKKTVMLFIFAKKSEICQYFAHSITLNKIN